MKDVKVYTWNLNRVPAFRDTRLPVADRVRGLKYVSFFDERSESILMLVFEPGELHQYMFASHCGVPDLLVGAGFVEAPPDGGIETIRCGGYSESLECGPGPHDTALLHQWLATLQ